MTGMLLAATMAWVARPQVKEAEKAAQMTEDVEVMRRLLNKTLGVPNEAGAVNVFGDVYYDLGTNIPLNNLNRANTAGWLVNPSANPSAWPTRSTACTSSATGSCTRSGLNPVSRIRSAR
jgi:hypothetical protein